jgi:transcriptional regulator with XRE-family HTH domain
MRKSLSHYNCIVVQDGSAQAVKNEFARRLEERRNAKGWNQSELARRATEHLPIAAEGQKLGHKIGRDQISHYSRGVSLPRPETLEAIAKALGCEPSDLLPPPYVPTTALVRDENVSQSGADEVELRMVWATGRDVKERISGATAIKILAFVDAHQDKCHER